MVEDTAPKILADVELIILACPVPAILDWLHRLPEYIRHACIVLDIGSSKRTILSALETLPPNFDPIGGHPICGRERLSLENAERFLYRDAPFVLTALERTGGRARSAALQLVETLGANPIWMDAADHDRLLAATSHLPYVVASALAHATWREARPLIGPGFRSTTRLAGTPSDMMLGVLLSNADNLLTSIARFRGSLELIESALQSGDEEALRSVLDLSRNSYQSLIA
jgi:prephenate dehydrogenase